MEKIRNIDFNDLYWHDAEIEKIIIHNEKSLIEMKIIWYDGERGSVFFEEVYQSNLEMNFGVIATQTILDAFSENKESSFVKNVYSKWKGLINNIDLNYYEIETNSTASFIKIVAKNFYVSKVKNKE